MARRISRASTSFSDIYSALVLPVRTIRLCGDDDLLTRRGEAQDKLDQAATRADITSRARDASEDESLAGEYSLAEEGAASKVQALQDALDAIDDEIDASDSTIILEAATPSEEDMSKIQNLFEQKKYDEWQVRITALALGQTPAEIRRMRGHVTRSTWAHLFSQISDIASGASITVPTRRPGSETNLV